MRGLIFFLLFALPAWGVGTDPFQARARMEPDAGGPLLVVELDVPPGHIVYADTFKVTGEGARLEPVKVPPAHEKTDKFTGELKEVFDAPLFASYRLADALAEVRIRVAYQGCDEEVCFFPQVKKFTLATGAVVAPADAVATSMPPPTVSVAVAATWASQVERFDVVATASGYMKAEPFLAFLGGGTVDAAGSSGRGMAATLLLILLGGLALNLTPCVLPLVPINLAILGAGTRASSKQQGFLLGGLYGLAIALVYGALGLAVVLFGAKFGALNASIPFNVVIAAVFLVMALAMFDVIQVDLSRFQSTSAPGTGPGRGKYVAALIAGAVSALLAGACVAPAVISTLLLSASLYAEGIRAAALLPFLLGIGMALPWPFAGAGLSVLPKPGAWMVRVKQAMGLLILIMAGYYAFVAWSIVKARREDTATQSIAALERALAASLEDRRPVFIDFWATWCKNCEAMEATTFQQAAVAQRFADMHVVKFQAEQPAASPAREVLDQFQVVGLPTYILLRAKP